MTGARDELERIYEEEGPRLWRALFAYSRDRDIADDAIGEAFADALSAADGLRSPSAWVWRVAFRIAAGQLKMRSTVPPPRTEATYEIPEPIDHLIQALSRLSPNQRLAVILHDYADRPTDEVARTIGATRATVYVHLSQGRKRLRGYLEASDD